ncbi:condensation domain-containing protein [Kitasatospora sp. MAP5-34]|uniref:condensation domain-containing protein n=1 Tax=Kitasatospora sp. MAP5-34 TaxID=3035102 RepID=UPI0024754163|nr:condensation domain-containing protein [Kitasatospora sp. MAP5-34]MDH6578820.1 hypothetical protein [Kitasatospora sp. MAP5-34]
MPAPQSFTRGDADATAPTGGSVTEETHAHLLRIHREILERADIALDDNFFDLGGNSLLAFRVIKRVAELLGARVSAQAVFTAGSIRELAARVDEARTAQAATGTDDSASRSSDHLGRASMAQEWAVLSGVSDPDAPALQFHVVYRVRGPLDRAALHAASQDVVDQHPALRTVLRVDGPTVRQHVADPAALLLVDDVSWLPEQDRPREALRILDQEVRRTFDRTRAPLTRTHLVRCAPDDHFLALVFDHVAADGWSLDVIVKDLGAAYRSRLAGEEPGLTDSGAYQDWSARQWDGFQNGRADEVAGYWKEQLGPDPAAFAVRLPGYRPDRGLADPASLHLDVPSETVAALDDICRQLRTTPYCVSLAVLKALIARQTGRSRVTVLTTAANRLEPEYQDTVGWFANGVFPTSDLDLSQTFRQLVVAVRETALAATAHGDLPAWYVRRRMWPTVPAGFRKDPGVYFMFNELWGRSLRLAGTEVEPVFLAETADSPGLHMWLLRDGPVVGLTVLHHRSEYTAEYVREFAGDFLGAVAALARRPDLPVREVLDAGRHQSFPTIQTGS